MITTVLVMDNRPEAVSSAHWGDVSTASTIFEVMYKLLETDAPGLAAQIKNRQDPLDFITLTSVNAEITKSRSNESTREETRI